MTINPLEMLNEARKIFAICIDKNISEQDSRLYSYIHFKILDTMNPNYFSNPNLEDSESLLLMIGDENALERFKNNVVPTINEENIQDIETCNDILNLSNKLKEMDIKLREEFGLENRIISELKYRLKLYTDKKFCDEKVQFYFNNIYVDIDLYDENKIKESFNNIENKKDDIDDLLSQIEGDINV